MRRASWPANLVAELFVQEPFARQILVRRQPIRIVALEQGDRLAGLISESFSFELPAPEFALAALKGLSHVAPHTHVVALKNADFSRDPEVVQSMDDDPLIANEVQPSRCL